VNAQRIPTVEPAIQRPTYDNTMLGWRDDWLADNAIALLQWWNVCGQYIDDVPQPGDYTSFIHSQYDLELSRREDYRNTLRQY